jgi:tetratricopeptide (TPR) repeat protein
MRSASLCALCLCGLLLASCASRRGPDPSWGDRPVAELEVLAKRDPRHAGAQLGLGIQYARARSLDRAVAAFERCIALAPDAAAAHAALGEIARRREDHARAAAEFAAAVRLDPGFDAGYLHAANAYQKMQDYRSARPLAEEYVRRRPSEWRGPFLLGMISSGEGRMDEALAHYEEAVRRDPGHAPAYLNAGATYLYGASTPERLAAAASWFERGVSIAPRYAELYYHLGLVRYRQRRWAEAAAAFQEAVTLQPSLGEAYYPLAHSLRRLGRADEAALALKRYESLRKTKTPSAPAPSPDGGPSSGPSVDR